MRNAWRTQVVVLLASVLAVTSCTSTQPDRINTSTASLFLFTGGKIPLYNCYEVWRDVNGDQHIDRDVDEDQGFSTCTQISDGVQRRVPWHYSINISIIHAGTSNEVTAVSTLGVVGSSVLPGDTVDDFISLTPYDEGASAIPDGTPSGDIYYVFGKEVSAGSPIYLHSLGLDPGPPNIVDGPPTFDFTLNSGDTVIVRARKQLTRDAPPFLPTAPNPELGLQGTLTIGGVAVAVQGTTVSSFDDGAGFTFSFTVR